MRCTPPGATARTRWLSQALLGASRVARVECTLMLGHLALSQYVS